MDAPQPPGWASSGTQASHRSTDPAGLSSQEALEAPNQRQRGGRGGVMLMGTVWEDENVLGTVVRSLPSCVKVLNTPELHSEKWLIGYIHVISTGRADAN